MMTAIKSSLTRADSLPNLNSMRTDSSLKSSFLNASTDSSDIISTAVLHKRRTQKRVRFALKLEPVEETSLPASRDASPSFVPVSTSRDVSPLLIPMSTSPSFIPLSTNRVIDPWRSSGPLYGAYMEYLEKQDAFASNESLIHRSPPPPPPPAPEPGAEPPTYTHTFVIQSKSPDIIIDSITVSSPPLHLPRICRPTKASNKHQSHVFDSYVKQQLTLSTASRILPSKKHSNANSNYTSVHAALKRAELALPPTNGLHANNKIVRTESLFGSKLFHDPIQSRKMTEIISKPLPGINNQINHFSDRSILPDNYCKKSRIHNRIQHTNDELNNQALYFFQNHENDHLLQPIIHSNR